MVSRQRYSLKRVKGIWDRGEIVQFRLRLYRCKGCGNPCLLHLVFPTQGIRVPTQSYQTGNASTEETAWWRHTWPCTIDCSRIHGYLLHTQKNLKHFLELSVAMGDIWGVDPSCRGTRGHCWDRALYWRALHLYPPGYIEDAVIPASG